jgi:hypothetical protein
MVQLVQPFPSAAFDVSSGIVGRQEVGGELKRRLDVKNSLIQESFSRYGRGWDRRPRAAYRYCASRRLSTPLYR